VLSLLTSSAFTEYVSLAVLPYPVQFNNSSIANMVAKGAKKPAAKKPAAKKAAAAPAKPAVAAVRIARELALTLLSSASWLLTQQQRSAASVAARHTNMVNVCLMQVAPAGNARAP
jgi:hypothetical protein